MGEFGMNTADGIIYVRQTVAGADTIVNAAIAAVSGRTLIATTITGAMETKTAPVITAGVVPIDCKTGNAFVVAMTAAISSFAATNVPPAGTFYGFILELVMNGTAFTATWTINGVTMKWAANIPPTLTSAAGKKDSFGIYTYDGGATWTGAVVGQNL